MNNEEYVFSDKEQYELIKEGWYEVVLDTAEIKTSKKNPSSKYISLKFIIRQDVQQPSCGRVIYENIFPDKTNPSQFNKVKLQSIILTQKNTKDFRTKFANNDDLVQYLNGLLMQVYIECKSPDEYHPEDYNEIKYKSYRETSLGIPTLNGSQPQTYNNSTLLSDDDDLPF